MSDLNQTTFLNVPMPSALKQRARVEAAHRGISMSDLARVALEKELTSAPATAREDGKEQPQVQPANG